MSRQRFRLVLSMRIEPVDDRGYSDGREGLSIEDRLTLSADNFLELAGVLSRFHDLAEEIKAEELPDGPIVGRPA